MLSIQDPRQIPQSDLPLIVSVASAGLVEALIRWRTKSWCNHSMLCINQGKFVWESITSWYGEGSMESYMKTGTTLKFYSLVGMDSTAKSLLNQYVQKRISAGPIDHIYDWIGIFGEAIGFPKIHTPGLEYCSVDDIHALKYISSALPVISQSVIASIPQEQNPGYLDSIMVNSPTVFTPYGEYIANEGVTVSS